MTEQKLITAYIDPADGSKAMRQIHEAAGEGTWRIVSIVDFSRVAASKRCSPGVGDPRLLEGEPVLVLLERSAEGPLEARDEARGAWDVAEIN